MCKRLLLLFIGVVFSFSGYNQTHKKGEDNAHKYFFEPKVHYGFILRHYPSMQVFVTGHFPAIDISIGKQTFGNSQWQKCLGYPRFGISYWYADLANKEILGQGHALYPFIDFTLYRGRFFTQYFRFGSGLGYLSKKYHRVHNYKNFSIGSHFHGADNLHFKSQFTLSKRWDVAASFGLTHFSNAAFAQPNTGFNILTCAVSSVYKFGEKKHFDHSKIEKNRKKGVDFTIWGGMGVKEMPFHEVYPQKYTVYFMSFEAARQIGCVSGIIGGVDVFYDYADIDKLERENISFKSHEIIKPGIHIGHNLNLEDFTIALMSGVYLYRKIKIDHLNYSKLAARYTFLDKYSVSLSLKVHLVEADFAGLAFGYKL